MGSSSQRDVWATDSSYRATTTTCSSGLGTSLVLQRVVHWLRQEVPIARETVAMDGLLCMRRR